MGKHAYIYLYGFTWAYTVYGHILLLSWYTLMALLKVHVARVSQVTWAHTVGLVMQFIGTVFLTDSCHDQVIM